MGYYSEFINNQLELWEEARNNYAALGKTQRRAMTCGDMTVGIQFNPARIRSTSANVSADAIKKRDCFLCAENRPKEQIALPIAGRFELLINPYPIFPVHFTIASVNHEPQSRMPDEMMVLAEELPGLTIFFNGAKAGASAPDHLHLQAVATHELPLMRFVEKHHIGSEEGVKRSDELSDNFPFLFYSAVIAPTDEGMKQLRWMMSQCGVDEEGRKDYGKVNSFFWISENDGKLRVVVIPRKSHRPKCYSLPEEERKMVSPGAVDMAGILITPREEDYLSLTESDVKEIYKDVAYSPKDDVK